MPKRTHLDLLYMVGTCTDAGEAPAQSIEAKRDLPCRAAQEVRGGQSASQLHAGIGAHSTVPLWAEAAVIGTGKPSCRYVPQVQGIVRPCTYKTSRVNAKTLPCAEIVRHTGATACHHDKDRLLRGLHPGAGVR